MSQATIDDHAHWLDLCAGNEPSAQDAERLHNIAVLLRALSAGQAQPVAIKPLEWELINGWWFGPTAEGQNYIVRASSATNFKGQWLWGLGVDKYELAPSLEAAKAAAQSDYEARIRSALFPPAVPGEMKAQLALIKHLAEYTTEKNWADKRLYIMQAVDRALSVPLPEIEGGDKGDGWQTMDTAPLDKTPIIIAVPTKDQDDFIVGEAYFDPEHYGDDGDWWWAGTNYGDYHSGPISEVNYHGPSFWQRLPDAPAPEGSTDA